MPSPHLELVWSLGALNELKVQQLHKLWQHKKWEGVVVGWCEEGWCEDLGSGWVGGPRGQVRTGRRCCSLGEPPLRPVRRKPRCSTASRKTLALGKEPAPPAPTLLASAEMPMDSATALMSSLLTRVSSAKRERAPLDSSSEKLRSKGQGQRVGVGEVGAGGGVGDGGGGAWGALQWGAPTHKQLRFGQQPRGWSQGVRSLCARRFAPQRFTRTSWPR